MDINKLEQGAKLILEGLQLDLENEHVRDTPRRVAAAYQEMCKSLDNEIPPITTFNTENDEMVIEDNVRFVSVCPHHLLPYYGKAHVGYIPDNQCIGLSKIPRLVRYFASQPIIQEDLTTKIANSIDDLLSPVGVAVVLSATHSCMTVRGVRSHETYTHTSSMKGCFLDPDKQARQEFFSIINASRSHI